MMLENMVKWDEQETQNQSFEGKVLILDGSNISYKHAHIVKEEQDEHVKWMKWQCRVINDILSLVIKFKPDRFVIALDDSTNWRKKIFLEYKEGENRHKSHAKIDKDGMKAVANVFFEELKSSLKNFIVLKNSNCEADDIVAAVTFNHLRSAEKIIIISSDKDFCQLHKYNKVEQYDVVELRRVEVLNPQVYLDIKVLIGDTNDNISSVKKGVGIKTAQAILSNGVDAFLSNNAGTGVAEKYELNRKLIDFEQIPLEISQSILEAYDNYQISKPTGSDLFDFFSFTGSQTGYNTYQTNKHFFDKLS